MFSRFFGFLALLAFMLPFPAAALDVPVHCWCKQTETSICNHNVQTFASSVPIDTAAATTLAFSASNRDATCNVCRTYCAGLAGGPWSTTHCESGYREEICGECYADAASSCTVERGARERSGSTGPALRMELPRCPTAVRDVFPVHLGTAIGGITEVNGLADYINVAYRYMVSIVLVVAIVMTVYGGFRYLFGASMGSVQAGKDIIRDALIGMLLVLGAYTILSTVNPATTILTLNPPEKIACTELDIPDAVRAGQCNTDSDCQGEEEHCVEAQYVYRTDTGEVMGSAVRTGAAAGSEAGGGIGAATHIPGAATLGTWTGHVIGAFVTAAGAGWWGLFNMGGNVKMCSNGDAGAPCHDSNSCDPGLYCLTNWNVCTPPTNVPLGLPCGPLDQDAGSTGVDEATCATDLECVQPRGEVFAGRDYKTCRGSVEPMLRIDGYSSNNGRVPDASMCYSNQDCGAVWTMGWITASQVTGMACIGPENPWRGRYCYPDSTLQAEYVHEDNPAGGVRARSGGPFEVEPRVTPCVHNGSAGSVVTPLVCSGGPTEQYTCVYCPSSGERVWTYLMSGSPAAAQQIGVCAEKVGTIGTPCTAR